MKILIKKLKRSNKVELTLYIISVLYYLAAYTFFIISLLKLKKIETGIRIFIIILFACWILYYMLANLMDLIIKKHTRFMIKVLLTILLSLGFTLGSYYINELYGNLNLFKENKEIVYTTNLISLRNTEFNDSSKIGIIQSKSSIEGYILPQELIKTKKLKNGIVTYNDVYSMLEALYSKDIDAMFITSNYISLFENDEEYTDISNETKVIYSLSKKMKNEDLSLKSNKNLTEPFTILVMGVDSEKDGLDANAAFNGDTLMLITFNPKTLNATIFSIPRDTYVPIACRKGAENKINSSAAYGTKCVIDTIENLTEIKIDYYVKINFKGVVNLVDALGGLDLDVTMDFCEQDSNRRFGKNEICLKKGYQHVNGEQALAFARHRHTLLRGDIDRTKNQQIVVEAITKKMIKNISFSEFKEILETISDNIATNLNADQILSFYDVLKQMLLNSLNGEDIITIQKTYLEYYDQPIYLSNGQYRSAIGYYGASLDAIKDLMKENLELKKVTMKKSFTYDYNVEYEPTIVGKGLNSGTKTQTLPSFNGYSISDVINWSNDNGIEVKIEYVDKGSNKYKSDVESGYVVDQSVRSNTRLSDIKTITVYINK